MNSTIRTITFLLLSGLIWYACFYFFFIITGAQSVLANPEYQSSKFLKVFMELQPAPRMVSDVFLIYKGFYIIGVLSALVFLFLNNKLTGGWLRKGLIFGLIHWALMIPWFEFYIPYNVMHEPFLLVLLEGILWLGTIISVSCISSFIINYKLKRIYEVQDLPG